MSFKPSLALRSVAGALLCAMSLTACAGSTTSTPATSANVANATESSIRHVFVIMLENKTYSETFSASSAAPYLGQVLAQKGALLQNYYGTGHVSLDNYISFVSGQSPTVQTDNDCATGYDTITSTGTAAYNQVEGTGCIYPSNIQTIADQLAAAGFTWKAYMGDMGNDPTRESATCGHPTVGTIDMTQTAEAPSAAVPSGDAYATRHDPFMYFHSIIDSPSCNTNVVNLLQNLPNDLQSVSTTANFTFITPNLCDDGHDSPCANGQPGGLASINTFLQTWVPMIMSSPAYQQDGLLMITFDESDTSSITSANNVTTVAFSGASCCNEQEGPNLGAFPQTTSLSVTGATYDLTKQSFGGDQVGAVLLSKFIKPGTVSATPYNHYAALMSIEDIFGLPHLGYAGTGRFRIGRLHEPVIAGLLQRRVTLGVLLVAAILGVLDVRNARAGGPGAAGISAQMPNDAAVAALGKKLFFDESLSASGRMSCATCHSPAYAYGPPNGRAVQLGGPDLRSPGSRAVPSLRYTLNRTPVWFHEHSVSFVEQLEENEPPAGGLTWDGRFNRLRDQAVFPLLNPVEMANANASTVVSKLRAAPYAPDFRALFGDGIFGDVHAAFARALYAIERFELTDPSFHPFTSKYDAYLDGYATLTPQELHGKKLFDDPQRGGCMLCHIDEKGANGAHPLFTDFQFEALGVPRNMEIAANRNPGYYDMGLCGPLRTDQSKVASYCGLFKTPSLRNVALRHVFFHNGRFHTLREALRFYVERDTNPQKWYPVAPDGTVEKFNDLPQRYRVNVDTIDPPLTHKLGERPIWSERDISDVIAFLRTLTDGYTRQSYDGCVSPVTDTRYDAVKQPCVHQTISKTS